VTDVREVQTERIEMDIEIGTGFVVKDGYRNRYRLSG